MIEIGDFGVDGWAPEVRKEERARWCCERLEEGAILFFKETPFVLPDEDRAFLLSVRQAGTAYHKNISYRPARGRVKGFARGSTDEKALLAILRAYSERVSRFVSALLLPYGQRWQLDVASFRPVEEHGRELSLRARNDLLHVDAFPTRPTNGDRLLRVFTNIHPVKSRVWVTTETFDRLAARFAASAGLSDVSARARSPLRPCRRWLIRLARSVGMPVVDRSPYDQLMLRFHHYLKTHEAFQESCPKYLWEFPPNSTWLVFTDMVPHAVLSGQFALEQTFIVRRHALLLPQKAPVQILEDLSGAPLTN